MSKIIEMSAIQAKKEKQAGIISPYQAAVLRQKVAPFAASEAKRATAMRRVGAGDRVLTGDVRLRADGKYVFVDTKIAPGIWGCDLLECVEGFPTPDGYPSCQWHCATTAALARMKFIDNLRIRG